MDKTYSHFLRAATLAALVVTSASAQVPSTAKSTPKQAFKVSRMTGSVRVDGNLDDSAWSGPPTFELKYETRPGENTPAPVKTEVWITYDSSNLYAAFHAYDPDPKAIVARYSDRDNAFNDDFVGFALDTFNDQRRAFEFFVNPLGVQMDLTQNEMTGNEDQSWDAIWDSAGHITSDGYVVEMRIPFSSLRFPSGASEMTWGIDAVRIYPRNQRVRIGSQPVDRSNNCSLCQASSITGIAGVKPARSLEFDPTITSSQTSERTSFPDGGFDSGSPETELGLTTQWGITPNMTFSGALNPDFSQVEADVAQLAVNTQFALFYPEKRPFFLEGLDIFDTRSNLIYSRNIADPEAGIKLTGKSGKNALGAIVAVDRVTNFLIPSSQGSGLAFSDEKNVSTILRYRRDLYGSTTGGLFLTDREGADGYHNRMLGGDILFKWHNTEALRIEAMGSSTKYPQTVVDQTGERSDAFNGHALRAVYQHTSRNWLYYALYRDFAKGFRADLGFVPRTDFKEKGLSLEHTWYPASNEWTQFRLGGVATDIEDQSGQHLERWLDLYSQANGPRQSFWRVDVTPGDLQYNGKVFDTDNVVLYGEMQATPDVFVGMQVLKGNQVDFANTQQGDHVRFDPTVRWNAGAHLRMQLDDSYEMFNVDGGRLFTANLTQLRTTYQINNRTFVRWIAQRLDVKRDPSLYSFDIDERSQNFFNQFLFSYKINPPTVLFIGYSDNYLGDQQTNLTQTDRTLFLKIGYAWQL
jgi:hypothetical protein